MRGVLSILMILGMAMPAWAAPPKPGTVQVLARDAAGAPTLARVALADGMPAAADFMHLEGNWSYLIADGARLVVFDVGARYPLPWWLFPWPLPKAWAPRLHAAEHVMSAAEACFPGRPIAMILLSHWHPDHTEDAPALQAAARARWGVEPPMRIGSADRHRRWRGVLRAGADAVFSGAGYEADSWRFGPNLRDGEDIGGTGFRVLALPGHTLGNLALVDARRRLSLGPPPRYELPKNGFWSEAPERFKTSLIIFYEATYGYRHYATHPGREALDDWATPPWDPPRKITRPAR